MKTAYVLKAYNEVKEHHFISEERWNELAKKELQVEFLNGFFGETAIVVPIGEIPSLGNTYMVSKSDLRKVNRNTTTNDTSNVDEKAVKEKTYTKDDIRNAGVRVMKGIESEETAIASALAIAKLINELN